MHLGHDPSTRYAKYTDRPVETFGCVGLTIDELHNVETLFEVNSIVYIDSTNATIPPPNLFDGLWENTPTLCTSIPQLYVRQSTWNTLLTHIKGYRHSYRAASVKSRCGNIRPGWNDRSWCVRQVFVMSSMVGFTTHYHQSFTVWTLKESPSSTSGDSTHIERRSTSKASLTDIIYMPIATARSGSLVSSRWVWVWLSMCRDTRLRAVIS